MLRPMAAMRRRTRQVKGDDAPVTGSPARGDLGPEGKTPHVIEAADVSHVYRGKSGQVVALDNISLSIRRDEFFCLLGPSGCGKSTFLRIVAGLVFQTRGSVLLNGAPITGPGPDRGIVFQQPGLFPWLTVEDNVGFGLRMAGWSRDDAHARSAEILEVVGLSAAARQHPYQLSGGQAQRAAVARAWALTDTSVLLMDEPFAAVDAITKTALQDHLIETWLREPRTVIYITHDIAEAVYLADRIVLLTRAPAQIADIYEAGMDRPRNRESDEAVALRRVITNRMQALTASPIEAD